MNWKERLRQLEQAKEWDFAIEFMQKIVVENQNDLDAYLSINYLLMNLLVEEDHDESKHDYYAYLTKKYFDESYAKFSHDPEYLYYAGRTAVMSEWYFGIDVKDYEKMLYDAIRLAPDNQVYQWSLYGYSTIDEKTYNYAKLILQEHSPIKEILQKKGSLGEYIFGMMSHWARRIVASGTNK